MFLQCTHGNNYDYCYSSTTMNLGFFCPIKHCVSCISIQSCISPSSTILLCFCFSNTVLSQQCYNQPNCVGDVVPGPTTAEECCVATDDGMSFGVSSGNCPVSQCIGKEGCRDGIATMCRNKEASMQQSRDPSLHLLLWS